MTYNLIILSCQIILGIFYIFTFSKIQQNFFKSFTSPKNNALVILFISSIISSSINLIHISDAVTDVMLFFLKQNNFLKGLFYAFCFFTGALFFSILFFRISFLVVGLLTPENEHDELNKNNKEIAWLHACVLLTLSYIIAPVLNNLAVSFIPYPKLPF